ncbi:exo-beta-N-acetylmuramidase NamZ family protein [Myroides sp. LJL119]
MVSNSKFKNTVLFLVFTLLFSVNVNSSIPFTKNRQYEKQNVKVGASQIGLYKDLVKGKKVGILTNQTGVIPQDDNLISTVDFLLDNQINLVKIFAPEHGFRGTADAGEHVKDSKDSKTGLPVISLYGKNKKPSKQQLQDVEVMLFDLQDVGARFYTYISSLHYLMQACAENNIPLILLDRPNPNIHIIDGPTLEMQNTSFVGMHPIPVLHGMTMGEYAQMIQGENWTKTQNKLDLTIIPCLNYTRDTPYSLPVAPSPNLPNDQSINLYSSLCFFEGTNVSSGRGTDLQFQIYGSPYLQDMPYSFTPVSNPGAKYPMNQDKLCYGENLSNHPKVNQLELKWLLKAYQNSTDKEKFFTNFFTKLAGTTSLETQIKQNLTEQQIRATWQNALEDFKIKRQPYLIYN